MGGITRDETVAEVQYQMNSRFAPGEDSCGKVESSPPSLLKLISWNSCATGVLRQVPGSRKRAAGQEALKADAR